MNPFQMRAAGVQVHEVPLQHTDQEERTSETHSISVPESGLRIPLSLRGIMSGFTVRTPTREETQDDSKCTHVQMTLDKTWDPNEMVYCEEEEAIFDSLNYEYDPRLKESREISPLQVRGESAMDLDLPLKSCLKVFIRDQQQEGYICYTFETSVEFLFIPTSEQVEDHQSGPNSTGTRIR